MRTKYCRLLAGGVCMLVLAGCVGTGERGGAYEEEPWGSPSRKREVDIGQRLHLTDEVDLLRDVDEKRHW